MDILLDKELVGKIVDGVRGAYGDNLISIILYGSVARNTATQESDIDIALIIYKDNKNMYNDWKNIVVDLDLEYDQVISTALIEKAKFEKWKRVIPYYKNIEREGIVLWKAA